MTWRAQRWRLPKDGNKPLTAATQAQHCKLLALTVLSGCARMQRRPCTVQQLLPACGAARRACSSAMLTRGSPHLLAQNHAAILQGLATAAPAAPVPPLVHFTHLPHLAPRLLCLPLLAVPVAPALPCTAAAISSSDRLVPLPLRLVLVLVGNLLERGAQQAAAAAQAAAQPRRHAVVLQPWGSRKQVPCGQQYARLWPMEQDT